jgi:hypothetical protein
MGTLRRLRFLKRPKVIIPLLLIMLVGALAVMAVGRLNSPAEGTVTTQSSTPADNKLPAGNNTYSDGILSFNYPARYQTKLVAKQSGYLDSVSLIAIQRRDRFVNIGVYSGTLANDSGVNYRLLHPEIYKKQPSTPQQLTFSKLDGTEYTGFIQSGSEIISISFTSVSPVDETADYHIVADSLKLK